jgi:hypothetical protein
MRTLPSQPPFGPGHNPSAVPTARKVRPSTPRGSLSPRETRPQYISTSFYFCACPRKASYSSGSRRLPESRASRAGPVNVAGLDDSRQTPCWAPIPLPDFLTMANAKEESAMS